MSITLLTILLVFFLRNPSYGHQCHWDRPEYLLPILSTTRVVPQETSIVDSLHELLTLDRASTPENL